jgi:cleavage and polyadenylation specificity factor subunit 3
LTDFELDLDLQDMFGEESVPKLFQGDRIYVTVDRKKANIDLSNFQVAGI